MFEGGFRIDSFDDLYHMPTKCFLTTEIAALEREIAQITKAVELLEKKPMKTKNTTRGRSV